MIFFGGHVSAAEAFGAVAHEHERLAADVGDLVVILGAEKTISFFSIMRSSPFKPFTEAFPSSTRKVSGDM